MIFKTPFLFLHYFKYMFDSLLNPNINKLYTNMAEPIIEQPLISQQQFSNFISAIKSGSLEQTEAILRVSNKAIVNKIQSQSKQPPLYLAAVVPGDDISLEFFKLLILHGANYEYKDNNQQSVLYYICREGKQKCLQLLLSYGLSMDEVDIYGQTPMFYAINQNKIEIVRKYATKQRMNHVDNLAGQTPLYYAARRGHLQLCRLLIQKGADISHVDSSGKTAVEYAKKAKYQDVADLLSNELRRSKEIMQSYSIEESNLEKRKKKEDSQKIARQTYKIVFLNEKGESRDLSEEEVRGLIKQKPQLQAYLSNPEVIPPELIEKSHESWQKTATKIATQCSKLKGAYWFLEPVDTVKFGILDYFDVVSRPMDLGTVRKKLSYNCYSSAADFLEEMSLIWENCYKYNGQLHDISKCAKELEISFKEYVSSQGLDKYLQNK